MFKWIIIFVPFLLPLYITISPTTALGQGFVYCYSTGPSPVGSCMLDYSVSPNPNCSSPQYVPPDCCYEENDGQINCNACCLAQSADNCNNVACVLITPTPSPTSTPSPCTTPNDCIGGGCPEGWSQHPSQYCSNHQQFCCQPIASSPTPTPTPTPIPTVPPSECSEPNRCFLVVCPTGWSNTEIGGCGFLQRCCSPDDPDAPTPTQIPLPTPGNCSSGNCPPEYLCTYGGIGACANNDAEIQCDCSSDAEPDGNCCVWAGGTYGCVWTGANCYTDVAGATIPYTCQPNWGHIFGGCESINNYDECMNPNPRRCVEENTDYITGYRCGGSAGSFLCYPCIIGSDDPDCNPPPYISTAECLPICSGQVLPTPSPDPGSSNRVFCDSDGNQTDQPADANGNPHRIYTAIGCIPVHDSFALAEFFLRWGVGIAGGFALILIVFSGYLVMTAQGIPQRLQAGKELLTATVAGLVLLLFSVYILQFIGFELFGIPSFQ